MKINQTIYLASKSPRRRGYLEQLSIPYTPIDAEVDESALIDEKPLDYLKRIVQLKTDAAQHNRPDSTGITITADTIVVLDDRILQKPIDKAEAALFLRDLAGKQHAVITGYQLMGNEINHYNAVSTDVWFRDLTDAEINHYLADDEYCDKAGAYAIQGLGSFMIDKIEGNFDNVVGLPIGEIFHQLQTLNIISL